MKPPLVGVVESFDRATGRGLIVGDFHAVAVFAQEVQMPGGRTFLREGEVVSFVLIEHPSFGRWASTVRPASEPALAVKRVHPCPSCKCRSEA